MTIASSLRLLVVIGLVGLAWFLAPVSLNGIRAWVETPPAQTPAQPPVAEPPGVPARPVSAVTRFELPPGRQPASGRKVAVPPIWLNGSRMPDAPIPALLHVPAGNGPFPAVILLHGCDGPFRHTPAWVPRLTGWGYAVLLPDSATPRGLTSVCDPALQPQLTARDRVGDVASASVWLQRQPDIDHARIAVLGLSHGGATAAYATQYLYSGMGLRAAVDYYGPCGQPGTLGTTPLLALAGDADDWGNPAARCRLFGAQVRPGLVFELRTYPGVYHAFDNAGLSRISITGHILEYNHDAAEDSFVRVHKFLDRWVMR